MFNVILPIIITVASVGLFFFQTTTIMDRITIADTKRSGLIGVQKSITDYQDLLKAKNDEFNKIDTTKIDALKKLLPDSIDNVKLIIDINQIASDRGMTIRNISIKGGDSAAIGPDTRPYGVATLGFSVSGPFSTFKQFLKALETSLRLTDVTAVSFSAGDKDQYEYNVEIKSNWLKQQ